MARVQAKFEVKPVAWAGEVVTKYQAFVTVTRPNGEEKTMTGDPMSTKDAAEESLARELLQRQDDITLALGAMK